MSDEPVASWQIVPESSLFGIGFFVLFFYLFFRHAIFVLMFMDIVVQWLRKFNWFPKEGKRIRTFVHWLIAIGLIVGYLLIGGIFGLVSFIPNHQ